MMTGTKGSWINVGHFMVALTVAILSMCRFVLMILSTDNLRGPARDAVREAPLLSAAAVAGAGVEPVPVPDETPVAFWNSEISMGGGALTVGVNQLASPVFRLATGSVIER